MNPIHALHTLRLLNHARSRRAPHVARLHAEHQRILARAKRRQEQAMRAQQRAHRLATIGHWLRRHARAIAERIGIAAGTLGIAWLLAVQPTLDNQEAQLAATQAERDQLRTTAMGLAQSQISIHLQGHRSDIQRQVRAIANDMDRQP